MKRKEGRQKRYYYWVFDFLLYTLVRFQCQSILHASSRHVRLVGVQLFTDEVLPSTVGGRGGGGRECGWAGGCRRAGEQVRVCVCVCVCMFVCV